MLLAYHNVALPLVAQVALQQQVLHASAIVTPSSAVVAFYGSSHAGKTTLAYGLFRRGFSSGPTMFSSSMRRLPTQS